MCLKRRKNEKEALVGPFKKHLVAFKLGRRETENNFWFGSKMFYFERRSQFNLCLTKPLNSTNSKPSSV